jgi:hypothetical protein
MSGGTTVQTAKSEPWEQQIPYLTKGFAGAEELLKGGLPQYYQGQTMAGFDPAQTAAQQATLGYAMGPRTAGMQMGAEGALGRSLGGYTGFNPNQQANLMAGNVNLGPNSPFASTANALQQQVMGQLKGNILPGLRQQQVQYQPGGSSRGNLVQNKAIANAVQQGLTKPLADMYAGAYQTAQGMRLPAAGMGIQQQQFGQQAYPSIMGAPMAMYDAMGRVGAQRRGMSQSVIDRDMARYNYEAMAPQNALNQYMNTISGNYGGTTTQTTPKQGGGIGSIIGAIAPLMMSDIRVKEDIKPVGQYRGMGVYDYKYKGNPQQYTGLMAQEVEQKIPDAVVEIGGIKHIDYGKV